MRVKMCKFYVIVKIEVNIIANLKCLNELNLKIVVRSRSLQYIIEQK